MKNLVLAPTEHNIIDTFLNDSLGRNKEVYNFLQLLYSTDESCSIALHGEWGSGKTFFIKQAKMILDVTNDYTMKDYSDDSELKENANAIKAIFNRYKKQNEQKENALHYTVYYDAWKNDNHEDPIMSLVYTIVKNAHIDFPKNEKSLGTVLKGLSKLVNVQFKHTVYQPNSATELSVNISSEKIDDFLSALKDKKTYKEIDDDEEIKSKVNELLDLILVEKADRLTIFIDELDRCTPTYAVKLLERIKHYFENNRITFVFSVNLSELQHTIKCLYGENFNATRYLDKFFDLTVELPPVSKDYFIESCLKVNFYQTGYLKKIIYRIIDVYNMQLREIARFIVSVNIATNRICQREFIMELPDERAKPFVIYLVVPVAIALKMTDGTKYRNFMTGKDGSPLFSVAYTEELENLLSWLSSDEEKKIYETTALPVKQRIESVYDAIFNNEYDENKQERLVGKCSFGLKHRKLVFELESLISELADYEVFD